jgi:uncharacterized protein (TIGR02118 family)
MTKVVWIARYRSGMPREAASRYWQHTHGTIAAKTPGLGRYIQNHAVAPLPPGHGLAQQELLFDGYSCAWYKDWETYDASTDTPEWAALEADSENVFDNSFFPGMSAVLEERTLKDGAGDFKLAFVIRFRPGLSKDEGRAYWRGKHADLVLRVPGLRRYVQNYATRPLDPEGTPLGAPLHFDGFAECWFQDRSAFESAAASPEWQAAYADSANVFDMATLWPAVVEEHAIKP